jgi:hypothetical protein
LIIDIVEGYHTHLADGAVTWTRAHEYLIVGTIFLFLIPFAVIGLGSGEDDENVLVTFTLLVAVPVSLCVTLAMFFSVKDTAQLKPEAWALVLFKSCNVTIEVAYGIYLVMYVIVVCEVLVFTAYGLLVYYGFKEYRQHSLQPVDDMSPALGVTQGDNHLSFVSRSRNEYGTDSVLGEERRGLLDSGDDSRNKKSKKDSRCVCLNVFMYDSMYLYIDI